MTNFTFPLSLADFLDQLPIASMSFDNPEQFEVSGTAGGEIIAAETGPQLWTGEIRLGKMKGAEADKARALIDLVRPVGRSFMVCRISRGYPNSDPTGTLLGGYSPVIDSLNADNYRLGISGLPAGYVLTRGDMLGFEYGSSPTRFALHRVVTGIKTANGSGVIDLLEVTPHIRTGA